MALYLGWLLNMLFEWPKFFFWFLQNVLAHQIFDDVIGLLRISFELSIDLVEQH